MGWIQIAKLFPTRKYKQIRSHAQKFYNKLKKFQDKELKIDFTSKNIKNINDMITHIKSINEDFNIVTVFLYLGEKHHKDINSNEKDKQILMIFYAKI